MRILSRSFLTLLLVSLVLAVMQGTEAQGVTALTACFANLDRLQKQNWAYATNHGRYAKTIGEVSSEVLTCPVSHNPYSYEVSTDGEHYTILCSGHSHTTEGAPRDHPWVSSRGHALR